APEQVINPNVVAELDAEIILLEADEDVLAEEIAGERASLKPFPSHTHGPLGVELVHSAHEVRRPSNLELDGPHFKPGIALEDPGEDDRVDAFSDIMVSVREIERVL